MLKLAVLMENTAHAPQFACEHGWSVHVQTPRHRLLFDAGQSPAFLDNARALGIDLDKADTAVLSHGHYDHSGGLEAFLRINHHAPVYLSRYALEPHYHGQERYIGVSPALSESNRLVFVEDALTLDEELELFSCNALPKRYPMSSAGLTRRAGDNYLPDDFRHEIYLLIHDGKRRVLLSGCSHKGILNIMDWLQPDVLIGGFHLMNEQAEQDNPWLNEVADKLLAYPCQYYTCHCTGLAPYGYLKEIMGDRLRYLAAGQVVEI